MKSLSLYIDVINTENITERIIADYNSGDLPRVQGRQLVSLLSELRVYFIDSQRYVPSVNRLTLCILSDQTRTFSYIRRKGLFRQSKYVEKREIVSNLVRYLLLNRTTLDISLHNLNYLESIQAFVETHRLFQRMRAFIVGDLMDIKASWGKSNTKSIVKTMISFVEALFQSNHQISEHQDDNRLSFYSKEDIAESFSLILFLYSKGRELNIKDTLDIDMNLINSGRLERLLVVGCKYRVLLGLEILIDHFGYCATLSRRRITIKAPDEELEMSIMLSWIRQQLQLQYLFHSIIRQPYARDLVPYEHLINTITGKMSLISYKEEFGLRRYRLEIPELLLDSMQS